MRPWPHRTDQDPAVGRAPLGRIRDSDTDQGSAGRTRAPRDESGPRRTNQGPAGRLRTPRDRSGPRSTNQSPRNEFPVAESMAQALAAAPASIPSPTPPPAASEMFRRFGSSLIGPSRAPTPILGGWDTEMNIDRIKNHPKSINRTLVYPNRHFILLIIKYVEGVIKFGSVID